LPPALSPASSKLPAAAGAFRGAPRTQPDGTRAAARERVPGPAAPAMESVEEGPRVAAGDELGEGWSRATTEILKEKGAARPPSSSTECRCGSKAACSPSGSWPVRFIARCSTIVANRDIITHAVQQHIPGARRVEIAAEAAAAAAPSNHPAVQAAVAMFQGEVVAVRPRAPEEGEIP